MDLRGCSLAFVDKFMITYSTYSQPSVIEGWNLACQTINFP